MLIQKIAQKIFGTQNERELKTIYPIVNKINELEPSFKSLTDAQLQAKTQSYQERLSNGETIEDLLPEAFATVREASWRRIGQRHYDVQLIGGISLHRGRIAEMKTGEGKTLVATLPAYLNALVKEGVHVITVNDYLARRDAVQMSQIYGFLGLSTGLIVHGLSDEQRKKNYACDVTYGTNNEFGFDYLRDNMKYRLEDYVQRNLHYAIVDEVDSILIDEARTPLIISGPTEESTDKYYIIDSHLRSGKGLELNIDYTVDEKSKTAVLTELGVDKMEQRLGIKNLYDPNFIEFLHHVNQGLRAHVLYKKDVDYVVRNQQIIIVDEFTGRLMPGRRWSDGLHQAIEAKEGVQIENENQTLASITFQNYFRMYKKLSGMTGTADTEATEFKQIYKLDVTVIPTNKPMIRKDEPDSIYKSEHGKLKQICENIQELQKKGQPILVGTISVDKSEKLASTLKQMNIHHNVLNAKQHERESEIIAQAGRKGSVTISTNMAGRGTDILLGGNPVFLAKAEAGAPPANPTPEQVAEHQAKLKITQEKWSQICAQEREEVIALGGLFILGTERHESRRIDNQLRGRAGRQGDPGVSKFYLSLEDDLMRIFGGDKIARYMDEGVSIENPLTTKAIANAQKRVEADYYDVRKHLLEYDNVMNQQRTVIYKWRKEVLSSTNLNSMMLSMVEEVSGEIAYGFFPNGKAKAYYGETQLNIEELKEALLNTFFINIPIAQNDIDPVTFQGLKDWVLAKATEVFKERIALLDEENQVNLIKMIMLSTIDHLWKDHLLAMDHLRDGVGLQGYGQKDPLIEYKKQGFDFFSRMMKQITADVVRKFFAMQITSIAESDPEPEVELLSNVTPIKRGLSNLKKKPPLKK